jgi:uncharacterized Fe-S cluster-containing radical SAM superfamily protein
MKSKDGGVGALAVAPEDERFLDKGGTASACTVGCAMRTCQILWLWLHKSRP